MANKVKLNGPWVTEEMKAELMKQKTLTGKSVGIQLEEAYWDSHKKDNPKPSEG